MLSLYIENSISFCVIMLLLWFDFHRNIPCLCYSIRSSPRLKSPPFSPYSIFVLKFLLFTILLIWVYSWLLTSQFSLASPVEFLQKSHNHLTFIMKFVKVLDSSKETSLQEWGPISHNLCRRIYQIFS